jgi:N-acetylglucosamine repressor
MELFSKVDLARDLGISTTTMTKLFSQLESDGFIQVSSVEDKSFGRPKTLFQLSPALLVSAVVIDVETTTISFSDLQGNVLDANSVSFQTGNDLSEFFRLIKYEFTQLRKKLGVPCRLVGVCIPGLIEKRSGRSVLNPNLPWLEGSCPAEIIQKRVGIPAFAMHEELALGRAQFKASHESQNYITLDFSAGVGMSVIANGMHLSGATGYAGEIGHIVVEPNGKKCGCGNKGCLETIASDRVFYSKMKLPADRALDKLMAGDQKALSFAREVVLAQAKGLAAAITIFNPEKIFVYSQLSDTFPHYIETLINASKKLAVRLSFEQCSIQSTREGKIKGTLLHSIDRLIEQTID